MSNPVKRNIREKYKKFRLVSGTFVDSPRDDNGDFITDKESGKKVEKRYQAKFGPDGKPIKLDAKFRNSEGDIVESTEDLEKKFGSNKFRRIRDDENANMPPETAKEQEYEDNVPGVNQRETLEAMTVDELRELAEAEEVDLSGLHKKDEIIDALLAKK